MHIDFSNITHHTCDHTLQYTSQINNTIGIAIRTTKRTFHKNIIILAPQFFAIFAIFQPSTIHTPHFMSPQQNLLSTWVITLCTIQFTFVWCTASTPQSQTRRQTKTKQHTLHLNKFYALKNSDWFHSTISYHTISHHLNMLLYHLQTIH